MKPQVYYSLRLNTLSEVTFYLNMYLRIFVYLTVCLVKPVMVVID